MTIDLSGKNCCKDVIALVEMVFTSVIMFYVGCQEFRGCLSWYFV